MPQNDMEEWLAKGWWMDGSELETEYAQAVDEGRDLTPCESDFSRLMTVDKKDRHLQWRADARAVVDRVQSLPIRAGYPYDEPDDLGSIHAARPTPVSLPTWTGTDDDWLERLHGGLLGRICGCLLGKPVEGWHRADIKAMADATGNWPLTGYLRAPTDSEAADLPNGSRRFEPWHASMLAGSIDGMVEDDDINYTVLGYHIVRKHGAGFRPLDVAVAWCDTLPIFHTYTAERVAYRNLIENAVPPQSASRRNPYREWIGAQIRADYFGYANPGRPERAAEWAWRDASVSHVKNGIYGEMWVAAMLAAAFVHDDWPSIIHAGLAQIPERCRLRAAIDRILSMSASGATYDQAVDDVHDRWNEKRAHDWCHTISNAEIVAIGLLWGDDDYERTITRAVMPGFDTDCNGATCGSLWGVKHGIDALPARWTEPIHDKVRTGVAGYHEASASKLAAEMHRVATECG